MHQNTGVSYNLYTLYPIYTLSLTLHPKKTLPTEGEPHLGP